MARVKSHPSGNCFLGTEGDEKLLRKPKRNLAALGPGRVPRRLCFLIGWARIAAASSRASTEIIRRRRQGLALRWSLACNGGDFQS